MYRKIYFLLIVLALMFCRNVVFAQIPLPTINTNYIIVVTNAPYNAVGDGVTTNTTAIQTAITAAAAGGPTNGLQGGTVEIPAAAASYLCGPLTLPSYVNLQIDHGATLQMLPYLSYPGTAYFISATKVKDIEISGFGTIDGQGAAWWAAYNASSIARPYTMFGPLGCNTVEVCNVTLQNPPNTHMNIGSSSGISCGNVLVTNVTINTPDGSPNTDGIDLEGTNVEIVNSRISDGDDHIAIGGNSGFMANILVTNCFFGTGHGCSIGSYTSAGVSNLMVINCTWSGSEDGIRVKTERGRGGLVQDLNYINLGMTNVQWPVLIYGYYNYGEGQLEDATPYMAATNSIQAVNSTTPIYRNILISNLTASAASTFPAIMIWGLPEMSISNVTLSGVTIAGASGTKTCQFYYTTNLQLINTKVTLSSGTPNYTFYGAQFAASNSTPASSSTLMNGLSTNGIGNIVSMYNASATLLNSNALAGGQLSLGSGTFTVDTSLAMSSLSDLNFDLGTTAATMGVSGNLALGGTVNVAAGKGFTNGIYTLFVYTGSLSGSLPTIGSAPAGYNYAFDPSTAGKLNLDVTLLTPPAPANLTAQGTNLLISLLWPASTGATSYDLQRSTTNGGPYSLLAALNVTNYSDSAVSPGTTYYYVVAATNSSGTSANSLQASAVALPSGKPTNINFQVVGNQLQVTWPADHLGWILQIQTNDFGAGLSTNWVNVPNSQLTNQMFIPLDPTDGSVFLQLLYP